MTSTPCRTDAVSQCVYATCADAKRVRSVLSRAGRQFPCVASSTGAIRLADEYLRAVESGATSGLRVDVSSLPRLLDALSAAGLHGVTKLAHKETSHGTVYFANVDVGNVHPDVDLSECERAAGTVSGRIDVAVKVMPLSDPKYHARPRRSASDMLARPDNSAYVDPFVAWMGSQMVSRGLSVGFPQLYGTLLVDMADEGGRDPVPGVAMVMEKLAEPLSQRMAEHMRGGRVSWEALIADVLQVMLVLAQGWHGMGFVSNDGHFANYHAAACPLQGPLRVRTRRGVLHLPPGARIVAIDFGRATVGLHVFGRPQQRLEASDIRDKFPAWERNSQRADALHFAAMLVMAQPQPGLLEREAAKPDAPPCARALLRLLRTTLQCDRGRDMFREYVDCHECLKDALTGCTHDRRAHCRKRLIHELREAASACRGTTPETWLDDPGLTAPFLRADEDTPESEVVMSPRPDVRLAPS